MQFFEQDHICPLLLSLFHSLKQGHRLTWRDHTVYPPVES